MTNDTVKMRMHLAWIDCTIPMLKSYMKELFILANRQGLEGIKYLDLIIEEPNTPDPLRKTEIYAMREGTECELNQITSKERLKGMLQQFECACDYDKA